MVMKPYKSILCCKYLLGYTFAFIFLVFITGCYPEISTTEQMLRFQAAGPITPEVDINNLLNAKKHTGYYRVIAGDILEFQMPAVLRVISPDLTEWFSPTSGHDNVEPYLFRVSDAGIITLPIVGNIPVVGMTLPEIELLVVNAYYPKYVENLPSLICKVKEYQTQNITIVGGVVNPGLYKLNNEEMSLVTALMKSGGIIDKGAALITIQHSDSAPPVPVSLPAYGVTSDSDGISTSSISSNIRRAIELLKAKNISEVSSGKKQAKQVDLKPIVLPVKDLNIPFVDVVLLDGDTIRVDKLNPEVFTVLGPVKSPGVFPYPPDVDYNIMQALAFAGGFDLTLQPSYVTMYRQDSDGEIVTATFQLKGETLAGASDILVKPGDVISVQMTADVRSRMIIRDMLDIRAGYDLSDLAD